MANLWKRAAMTVVTTAVLGCGLLAGAGGAAADSDWHDTGVTTAANNWYGTGVTPADNG